MTEDEPAPGRGNGRPTHPTTTIRQETAMDDDIRVDDPVMWNEMPYRVVDVQRLRMADPHAAWVLLEPVDPDLRSKWVPAFECRRA